jgi:hypothetical protein
MKQLVLVAAALIAGLSSCSEPTEARHAMSSGSVPSASKSSQTADPTATWKIPLDEAGLALKSDGRFGDGSASVYANGVCGVSTRIFSAASESGDATLQTSYPKGKGCGRTVIMAYPDGGADTLAVLGNLNKLESADLANAIPIAQTSLRRLIIGFNDRLAGNPTAGRCGRVIFGDNGTVGAGTDMLLVTRVDATTWHVQSQPAPNNRALCENLSAIYDGMNVDLTIVSSTALP